ncbi:conjugal transfer protein TrbA [Phytobacter diazotrophicus]|uniref:secretion/conjugation apparatus DotM-related subunit n=1 Tax=Phytobacter diazotrophicus TaxID=395631 RepID=UPI001C99DA02|nr:conjugal transfer protein TrbA [Phytobacter diazotrophicus]MBY6260103.1 conjugal transfer protein TrbA [Phytobacter diazotrophicus]
MSSVRPGAAGDPMEFGAALAILGLLLLLVAWLFLPEFVFWSCFILHTLWGMVDFGPFHALAAPRYNLLATTGNNAENVSFEQWVAVMEQTTGILMVFLIPLSIASLWSWVRHPARNWYTRRVLNIHTLPFAMESISPAIAPILNEGDPHRLLLDERRPERRPAQRPEEFAQEHRLISNMQLDVARCREVFLAQLGKPLTGWKSLSPHEKALFAIFGLQFFLDDRPAAKALMDMLNRSCRLKSRRDSGKFSIPVYSLAKPAFIRVTRTEGAKRWLQEHRYVRSGLVWLYAHDLRLPPPNWLWLKGIDRTLFYGLHRANTTKGFIEGAGIVAVARTENEAIRMGLPCPEVCVEEAIDGFRVDMLSLGLIWDEPQPDRDRKRRIRNNWSLTDDVLSRPGQEDDELPF